MPTLPNRNPRMNPRDKRPRRAAPFGRRAVPAARSGRCSALCWCWRSRRRGSCLPTARQITYSDFKQAVRRRPGCRSHRRRADDPRHAIRREAERKQERSPPTRIEDPKLLEELDSCGVKYTGEFVSRWMPESWAGSCRSCSSSRIWSFFFRRIGGAEGGVMSFARSKHACLRRRRREGELRRCRRRGRGRAGAQGDRRVPEEPEEVHRRSAGAFRRACCWSARREPARRCSRARWRAKPRSRSSA